MKPANRLWLPVGGALLLSLSVLPTAWSQSGKGGSSQLSAGELAKRLENQERAQMLVTEGDALAAEGRHCDAADKFQAAANALQPGAPATEALRSDAVKKFAKSGVSCARDLAADGSYEPARTRLNAILAEDMAPNDKPAQTLLKQLDDPDRFNPAMTPQHAADVKKVSKLLVRAEHFVALGDFDSAEAAYNQVLAVDATNRAARRGLEQVEKQITEFHKSSRDHARAQMLNQVDRAWEQNVPRVAPMRFAETSLVPEDAMMNSVEGKLRTIVIPRVSLGEAPIAEAISHLAKKSMECDPQGRGVNIVYHGGGTENVSVDLKNVTLGDALKAVCDQAGLRYRADGNVVIVSRTAAGVMETRQFRVPPGFLSSAASAAPTEAADPFAKPDAGAKPKIGRLDPKTYLINQGILFPDGARAGYNAGANMLIVTNTAENLEQIAGLVEGLVGTTQRQALVSVLLLKASQVNLREAGGDFMLDAFSVGGSDRVFAGGGTYGNSSFSATPAPGAASGFVPNGVPFNVVNGPVTAGLRSTYELTRQQNIDDLIAIGNRNAAALSPASRSPYVAGIGGLFTTPRFQALVRQLDQKKGIDLSVANKVVVKSGQKATAFSGRDFSYPTEFDPPQIPQTVQAPRFIIFDPTTGQVGVVAGSLGQPPVTPATPTAFETKQIGSTIEVEATIGEDGYTVDLNLAVSFSEFDGFINYGTPITSNSSGTPTLLTDNRIIQPVFSKASANAQVLIYDGQTVAIGGLTQHKSETIEDKVPVWSSIPIIGKFFKTDLTRDTRMAVIYFVTVHVVDPTGENVHSHAPAPVTEVPAPADPPFDPEVLRAASGK